MSMIDRARQLRAMIEENAQTMEPETAQEYPELFPEWRGDGRLYTAGMILRRNGELVKVLQEHFAQEGWEPEHAPSLFTKVLTDPTGETILAWEQPDSTNGYMTGDRVLHKGLTWESTVDNNVWEPGAAGTGNLWMTIEEE